VAAPFDDRVVVPTPEGVAVELVVAGVGSRFVARLLDSLLQLVLELALLALIAAGGDSAAPVVAGYVGSFLVAFGYDIAFEVLGSGRTPGKRWTSLRVVGTGGEPVGLAGSTVRNLLRLVDALPAAYLVGIITIAASARQQRVGDHVAGTLVVRERRAAPALLPVAALGGSSAPSPELLRWDVSRVTDEELAVARSFLQRRDTIHPTSRARLAVELAGRLSQKVVGPVGAVDAGGPLGPEEVLARIVAAKDARR
jgi:uncharacterized RDD family membrane protein YckC